MRGAINGAASVSRLLEPQGRTILVPFDKRECISLKQAADIAGKSESTMRAWAEEHGLGRRIGDGIWSVSLVALAMFLDGNRNALRAYHQGDRVSEAVLAYYRRAGFLPPI
jgi:hypothetical protein